MNKRIVFVFCNFLIIFLFTQFLFAEANDNLSLGELATVTESRLSWDPLTESGVLEKNGNRISFRLGDNLVLLDYSKIIITDPPFTENGIVKVTQDFKENVLSLFENPPSTEYFRVGAVLIDAGHGGKDPGAVSTHVIDGKSITLQEKDITLDVSKKILQLLTKSYPDKKILLTRSDDRFLSLEQRVEIANSVNLEQHEAILYVSVHANSAFDKKASGFEVWYLSPGYRRTVIDDSSLADKELLPILNSMMEEEYTTESILIAKYILDGLDSQIGQQSLNRGIKEEEWFVVRNANMPSVLIELGFVSNPAEAALLTKDSYLQKMSLGIYNGISSFISHFERSRGFTGL